MAGTNVSLLEGRAIELLVIGGSAGVLDVLRTLFKALPSSLSIPVVIVVHLPPRASTALHETMQSLSSLPLRLVDDKEPLRGGRIYFAPAGYHLLIESDRTCALSLDEPVHYSRPSIDVLFQSASEVYGSALAGVLLTGASADGAQGLRSIHLAGGLTIVQDPNHSEASIMPRAAIDAFNPDHVLPAEQIAALLGTMTVRTRVGSMR